MLHSELCIDVIESFHQLQKTLTNLKDAMVTNDHNLPAFFQAPAQLAIFEEQATRQQAFTLINQIEFLNDQNPREILIGAGLIAASASTLEAVQQLNQSKLAFKQAMLNLKTAKVSIQDPALLKSFEPMLEKHRSPMTSKLKKMGLARLHLKQCYRLLPFFEQRPKKISWTWANTRAIKRIDRQQAETLLRKQGSDEGIQQQLNKLSLLGPQEPLAVVQELAPHLRCNILFEDGSRKMVKGPVPIFYLSEDDLPLPLITPPKDKQGRSETRTQRSDVKLEPEPFLPAIHAHRYKVLEMV